MTEGLKPASLRTSKPGNGWPVMLLLAVLILSLLAALYFLFKEDLPGQRQYSVLYSGLSDKEGGEVIAALERLNIPYRLAESSGAIEVPGDSVRLARYKLAMQGLPKGDRSGAEPPGVHFGLSSFQEQQLRQHALENELARSIEMMDGVMSARVHLAIPKPSAFLREQTPPSASVMIRLQPGIKLARQQLEAMRLLVAGSVPGLEVGRVGLLDQHGFPVAVNEEIELAPNLPGSTHAAQVAESPAKGASGSVGQKSAAISRDWLENWQLSMQKEVALGALLAFLLALFFLGKRVRSQNMERLRAAANLPRPRMEEKLESLRLEVIANPRIAASVVKLWMHEHES